MIRKSFLVIGQVLGLLAGDGFIAPSSLATDQYSNYYFQFRAY